MKSLLNYYGGKSRLVPTIAPIINATPHTCYCEPFCGAGWIFFGKDPKVSCVEILNDADGELINFWRVVQKEVSRFLKSFQYAVTSREIFNTFKQSSHTHTHTHTQHGVCQLTSIERAHRYYYLQKLAFGGKVTYRSFAPDTRSPMRLNIDTLRANINDIHKRMSRTVIENLDALECIRRYDSPDTLFFIDPPYVGCDLYEAKFPEDRFKELAKLLKSLRGKFLLTVNDSPQIRKIFKSFKIRETETWYSVAKKIKPKATELLIQNY